jgi:hypothetical protein
MGRRDLVETAKLAATIIPWQSNSADMDLNLGHSPAVFAAAVASESASDSGASEGIDNGMNVFPDVTALRFGSDRRLKEVRRLLDSAQPAFIRTTMVDVYFWVFFGYLGCFKLPEMSELDFVKAQATHLAQVLQRTLALSIGRAMFTFNTLTPVVTEAVGIPALALNGRGPNNAVPLDVTALPKGWGFFVFFVHRPKCNKPWGQPLRHGPISTMARQLVCGCVRPRATRQSAPRGWRSTDPRPGSMAPTPTPASSWRLDSTATSTTCRSGFFASTWLRLASG